MKTLGVLAIVALVFFSTPAVLAEDAPEMPKPTKEHQVLETWLGTWNGKGEMKAGPMGPGGPMEWSEKCTWFEGAKFHLLCNSKGTTPMGSSKGLSIIGFHSGKKVYTHYGVDSMGWGGYAEGTREGDTWTYTSEEVMEGMKFKSRFKVTMNSPTEMAYTWETSLDGRNWLEMMTGTSTKR